MFVLYIWTYLCFLGFFFYFYTFQIGYSVPLIYTLTFTQFENKKTKFFFGRHLPLSLFQYSSCSFEANSWFQVTRFAEFPEIIDDKSLTISLHELLLNESYAIVKSTYCLDLWKFADDSRLQPCFGCSTYSLSSICFCTTHVFSIIPRGSEIMGEVQILIVCPRPLCCTK